MLDKAAPPSYFIAKARILRLLVSPKEKQKKIGRRNMELNKPL